MYRIEGICDRIEFDGIEIEDAENKFKEIAKTFEEESFINLIKNYQRSDPQLKIFKLISRIGAQKELKIIFNLINKNYEAERTRREKGMGTYLMAILLNFMNHQNFWINISEIVSSTNNEEVKKSLNGFLSHQVVLIKVLKTIENFFKTLCQVDDEYFVDTSEAKCALFHHLKLNQVILIIHQLLQIPEIAGFVSQKIFVHFELSPEFIRFLKINLRNLSF